MSVPYPAGKFAQEDILRVTVTQDDCHAQGNPVVAALERAGFTVSEYPLTVNGQRYCYLKQADQVDVGLHAGFTPRVVELLRWVEEKPTRIFRR